MIIEALLATGIKYRQGNNRSADVPKNIRYYIICFILGLIIGISGCYFFGTRAIDKLNADLTAARTSLASATAYSEKLATSIQQLSAGIASANQTVAGQQRLLSNQQQLLSNQQQIIDRQQSTIDEQKRIVENIITAITNAGGDISGQLTALTEGFEKLYQFYHPSSTTSENP
jgi:predicted transcriptional regulator